MKEILIRNAGISSVLSAAFFASMLWWYATQMDHDISVNFLIIAGFALVLLNLLTLWVLSTTKSKGKKKGKK